MQDGDLSNEVAPRMLFVYEGVIGFPRSETVMLKERVYLKMHRWAKAVDCWDIPSQARNVLWDVTWRWNFRFDIVTFRPAGFATALRERLDNEGIPFTRCWASSPARLAKQLAYMPDVKYVYDADTSRRFTFGGKGVHLPGGLIETNPMHG